MNKIGMIPEKILTVLFKFGIKLTLNSFNSEKFLNYLVDYYAKIQITTEKSKNELYFSYEAVSQTANMILLNKVFNKLPPDQKADIIVSICNTLMSGLPVESAQIADYIALHYQRMLNDRHCKNTAAMKVFDCLYALYFSSAINLSDMKCFDDKCVKNYEWYLINKLKISEQKLHVNADKDIINLCYFVHCAHFEKGNAVSPLIASLAKAHSKMSERNIFIYCVQWISDEFKEYFSGCNITIRNFKQNSNYDKLDEIITQAKKDELDVIISDLNSAIATYIFTVRAAPVQMWIDMGYPYWSIQNLDWAFIPGKDYQPVFGIPKDRFSYINIKQDESTLRKKSDASSLYKVKKQFPENAFIYATFNRLIKITPFFLEVVRRLLFDNESAHMLIVGKGDPRLIYDFIEKEKLLHRITVINNNVDLNVYGRVIHVFLDTFPFIAGLAAREVGILGKPVVSMRTQDWERFLDLERSPELLVDSIDDYVNIANRLYRDNIFYAHQAELSSTLISKTCDVGETVRNIEKVVNSLINVS